MPKPSPQLEGVCYSVVIPVYNSAAVLPKLFSRLVAVMETLGEQFELLFVDDNSADGSWAVLEAITRGDPRVSAIGLAGNVGQGTATLTGLRHAEGKILITLDDDLEHSPEDIPALLARLDGGEGYNVVFGISNAVHRRAWRRVASWAMNIIFSPILRKPLALRFSGFRAMRRSAAEQILALRVPDPFVSALLFQITPRIGMVHVNHTASALPSSRHSFARLARLSLAYFDALSDRDRERFVVRIAAIGMVSLMLAALGLYLIPPSFIAGIAIGIAIGLTVVAASLGLAGAISGFRIRTFRRNPAPEVAIRRIMSARPETFG